MGIKMHEMARGEATAMFNWEGHTIHVTFNPNDYTAQAEAEWTEVATTTMGGETACAFVKKLVKKWDVYGDVEFELDGKGNRIPHSGRLVEGVEGVPFPLDDMEKLRYIPLELLGEAVDAIQREMIVGKAMRQASEDGSATAEIQRRLSTT